MRGSIVVYRPVTGDGLIVSTAGKPFRITPDSRDEPLQGGDIVTFDASPPGSGAFHPMACNIRVVERWADTADARRGQDLLNALSVAPV